MPLARRELRRTRFPGRRRRTVASIPRKTAVVTRRRGTEPCTWTCPQHLWGRQHRREGEAELTVLPRAPATLRSRHRDFTSSLRPRTLFFLSPKPGWRSTSRAMSLRHSGNDVGSAAEKSMRPAPLGEDDRCPRASHHRSTSLAKIVRPQPCAASGWRGPRRRVVDAFLTIVQPGDVCREEPAAPTGSAHRVDRDGPPG